MSDIVVSCPNCKAKYNVGKFEPGTKFKCKSCGKFLLVPDMPAEEPEMIEESSPKQSSKKRSTGSSKAAAKGGKSRGRSRDDYDDEDERPLPRQKKSPPWAILGAAAGVLLLIAIIGGFAISSAAKKAAEAERKLAEEEKKRKGAYKNDLPADGFKQAPPEDKYKQPDKKNVEAGTQLGDGKIKPLEDDKEEKGEETIRSGWKDGPADEKARRWKLRKQLLKVSADSASRGKTALDKFKSVFGEPDQEREALEAVAALGKDCIPVCLNYLTKEINHMQEQEAMMASQIFNLLRDKALEFWKYENEFNYGMFEALDERWNAIIEMKDKCLKEGYKVEGE